MRKMQVLVVPGNGQALLGMPDTDVLNIININVHSIGVEDAGDSMQCANTHTLWGPPKYRKHTELRTAIQTKPAFTNLQTITQGQWSMQKLITQQGISLQG